MKSKKERFKEFESERGYTDSYAPPKYLVKPAIGEEGFYFVKSAFDDQEQYFTPGIRSSNKELPKH